MSEHTPTGSDQPSGTCPNCGAATSGAAFCPTCGTALQAGAQPQAPPAGRTTLSAEERRMWAMGGHLSAFVGAFAAGLGSFIGPLVVWLIRREDDPYIAGHAAEALNFNITVDLIVVAGVVLGFLTLGIGFLLIGPILLIVGILWLIFTIQATMAASRNEPYRYPMSIRFVR